MSTVEITVLPVGQGTGTLIQRFEGVSDKPLSTVLVDLGSALWKPQQTGFESAKFVEGQLRKMENPTLNAVFLSHGDVDHTNLITSLLKKFSPPCANKAATDTLTVRNVYHGGRHGEYRAKNRSNCLDELDNYRSNGVNSIVSPPFGPSTGDLVVPIYQDAATKIYIIAGNVIASTTRVGANSIFGLKPIKKHYASNTTSLVLLVALTENPDNQQHFVLTGDTTAFGLAHCNDKLALSPLPPSPVATVTLPHHGSKATTYDLLGAQSNDPGDLAEENIRAFVARLRPQSLAVSAGEVTPYKHPAARAIKDFGAFLRLSDFDDSTLRGAGQHFFTSYFQRNELEVWHKEPDKWPATAGWKTVQTDMAVYTTDYFKGDPATTEALVVNPSSGQVKPPPPPSPPPYDRETPRCCGWTFQVRDGKCKVLKVLDLKFLSSAGVRRPESRHGPLLLQRFVSLPSAPSGEPPPPTPPSPADIAAAPGRRPPSEPASGRSTRLRPLI
ncbi:hypothetical protein [Streptomyces atroolivaceus]|uniref:hypothetical protein n=1 Tax=Streptomyces atroolivaceus TaxID=66869 RepID=UPI0037B60762